jgi:predicted DNA binding CopG/RHH family protein
LPPVLFSIKENNPRQRHRRQDRRRYRVPVLHFEQRSNTITIRLPEDLAQWLELAARKAGLPKGRIVREELEKARSSANRPFLRLAGAVDGPAGLSMRKGFSRK